MPNNHKAEEINMSQWDTKNRWFDKLISGRNLGIRKELGALRINWGYW